MGHAGASWEEGAGCELNQAGGEPAEREVPFGGSGWGHKQKLERLSLVCLNVTRSVRGGHKGELVTEIILSPWCTWSSVPGAYSLFVGMLRHPEDTMF